MLSSAAITPRSVVYEASVLPLYKAHVPMTALSVTGGVVKRMRLRASASPSPAPVKLIEPLPVRVSEAKVSAEVCPSSARAAATVFTPEPTDSAPAVSL